MGRKLTSGQRYARERMLENERKGRARKVADRRASAKEERDELQKIEKDEKVKEKEERLADDKKAVKDYESFYNSLTNLHLHPFAKENFHEIFSQTKQLHSELLKPISPLPYNFLPKSFQFNSEQKLQELHHESRCDLNRYCKEKNIAPFSERLEREKRESQYDFNQYCHAEGKLKFPLFVLLFGTKNKHKKFISEKQIEYDALNEKVTRIKNEYEKFLKEKKSEYEVLNSNKIVENERHQEQEQVRRVKENIDYNDLISIYSIHYKIYEKNIIAGRILFKSKEEFRKKWQERLCYGDPIAMEEACEIMFPLKFNFADEYATGNPTESSVGYRIVGADKVEVCINLPSELDFLPEYGMKLSPSEKSALEFINSEKIKTDTCNKIVCSLAFAYLRSIFTILKSVNHISIEIGIRDINEKTGKESDILFLSMEVLRSSFVSLNVLKVDPLQAIENFHCLHKSVDSKKNITSTIDRENLIWALDDDSNIELDLYVIKTFHSDFYEEKYKDNIPQQIESMQGVLELEDNGFENSNVADYLYEQYNNLIKIFSEFRKTASYFLNEKISVDKSSADYHSAVTNAYKTFLKSVDFEGDPPLGVMWDVSNLIFMDECLMFEEKKHFSEFASSSYYSSLNIEERKKNGLYSLKYLFILKREKILEQSKNSLSNSKKATMVFFDNALDVFTDCSSDDFKKLFLSKLLLILDVKNSVSTKDFNWLKHIANSLSLERGMLDMIEIKLQKDDIDNISPVIPLHSDNIVPEANKTIHQNPLSLKENPVEILIKSEIGKAEFIKANSFDQMVQTLEMFFKSKNIAYEINPSKSRTSFAINGNVFASLFPKKDGVILALLRNPETRTVPEYNGAEACFTKNERWYQFTLSSTEAINDTVIKAIIESYENADRQH